MSEHAAEKDVPVRRGWWWRNHRSFSEPGPWHYGITKRTRSRMAQAICGVWPDQSHSQRHQVEPPDDGKVCAKCLRTTRVTPPGKDPSHD